MTCTSGWLARGALRRIPFAPAYDAVSNADATAAWEASSSAAGALMMLARVQQDLTSLLSPPQLQ